jgi:hypothetical protein
VGAAAEANPFYAPTPPSVVFIGWSIAWIVLVLGIAVVSLDRREI